MYINAYQSYRKVTFGEDTIITKFEKMSVIQNKDGKDVLLYQDDYVKITIDLRDYEINKYDDETGYYRFDYTYSPVSETSTIQVKNLSLAVILQSDWVSAKSDERSVALPTSSTPSSISFKQVRKSPLWFVSIKRPNLYIQVSYDIVSNDLTSQHIKYFTHSLNGLLSNKEYEELTKDK